MASEPVLKRGYVKWEDDNGVRHKVPLVEYNAMAELEGKPMIEGDSAPARGPTMAPDEVTPEVSGETPAQPAEEVKVGNNGHNTESDAEVVSEPIFRDR